jgi:glycosyltransferase involved in cell wall biosynthesis
MKISMLQPHLKCCGGIRRIMEVSVRLKALGHEVSIFTPKGRPCTWIRNDVLTYKISELFSKEHEILIFNLAEQYVDALRVKASKKFFWVLAPEAEYKDPKVPIAALRTGKFRFLTNSKYTQSYIKRLVKVNYEIPIIPGGINPEHFKYVPETPKTHHVLYYGSLRPWKGAKIIEDAIRGMPIKVLKMEGLNTPQEEMWKLYNSVNMFVSANFREGFSLTQLEAMACGCPVVTTDDGGSRDYVKSGKNAILCARTPQGIKSSIMRLLADKTLRNTIRSNGLLQAKDPRYSWEFCTNTLIKSLEN